MLALDKECWSRTTNYDLEKNQQNMQEILRHNMKQGLDPYYYLKWDNHENNKNKHNNNEDIS
jgi:hypothetical protein